MTYHLHSTYMKTQMLQRDRKRSNQQGFSLIEVAMAMAITAFAILTTIAVFPLALKTFQESRNETIGAQIVQQIVNEFNLSDVGTIYRSCDAANATNNDPLEQDVRYYDDQGVLTAKDSRDRPPVYTATINVGIPRIPAGSPELSSGLMVLEVALDVKSATAAQKGKKYTVFIANQAELPAGTRAFRN
jgi:uncharacterized protein (TIGR02598 family)